MAATGKALKIRELKQNELASIYPMLKVLNPGLSKPVFLARLKLMKPLGYRAIAVYAGNRMVGISGFWMRARFWCGREMDIDNFVVHPDWRRAKVGDRMLAWLEKKAKQEKVQVMVLDAYAHNALAHRFYYRHDFTVTGFHMTKTPGSRVPLTGCYDPRKR